MRFTAIQKAWLSQEAENVILITDEMVYEKVWNNSCNEIEMMPSTIDLDC